MSTCAPLAAAAVTAAPAGGAHRAASAPVRASTRRAPRAVTWRSWSNATLAHSRLCAPASNPAISVSASSSSSSIASTRVSPTKESTRCESYASAPDARRFHMPLMPGSSTAACSLMPTPLRTTRRLPSRYAPEHVTTCPWPWRSRSTTWKSTIGPRLVKRSSTSTYDPEALASRDSLTSIESPCALPTNTTPLSRYVSVDAAEVVPSFSRRGWNAPCTPPPSPGRASTSSCRLPRWSESRYREPSASTRPAALMKVQGILVILNSAPLW